MFFSLFSIQYLIISISLILFANLFNFFWIFTLFGSFAFIFWISWLLTNFLRDHIQKQYIDITDKLVIVTGCDSGFGYLTAKELNAKGVKVLATCLNTNGIAAKELNELNIETIEMNITNEEHIKRVKIYVENYLRENNCVLWAIVNNAGVFTAGQTDWGTVNDLKYVFDVNVFGLTQFTRYLLPLIRKSRGRVINFASGVARLTLPGLGFYGMSKYAVIAFSDALRREMIPWNVKVITIEPEAYKTPMADENRILSNIDSVWECTAPEVKSDYGENYFQSFKQRVILFVGRVRPYTQEVANAATDAVINVSPKNRYLCYGYVYSIVTVLFHIFPNELMDKPFILYNFFATKPLKN